MIGAEMVIDGNVSLKGGLIVYGKITGDVQTDGPVRVAGKGEIIGNISASDIHINGRVFGINGVDDTAI